MTVPILEEPPETTKPLELERPAAEIPPLKVEVPEPVTPRLVVLAFTRLVSPLRIDLPAVTVRPWEEFKPVAETPPVNVEVATPVTPRAEVVALLVVRFVILEVEASKVAVLPMVKVPLTVEEACETKPPLRVARLPLATVKLPAIDEEAVAAKPPKLSKVKMVVEAEFWTIKALETAELVAVRKVRIVEVLSRTEVVAEKVAVLLGL